MEANKACQVLRPLLPPLGQLFSEPGLTSVWTRDFAAKRLHLHWPFGRRKGVMD